MINNNNKYCYYYYCLRQNAPKAHLLNHTHKV